MNDATRSGLGLDDAAMALAELGNPVRLAAFRLLIRAGHAGRSVGSLAAQLEVPNSTFTHHIAHLVRAGLIRQERDGRTLVCVADFGKMRSLVAFLQEECCVDEVALRTDRATTKRPRTRRQAQATARDGRRRSRKAGRVHD